ncbi:lactate utilization protein B/C [Formosa sediminum]|uniref:Lactate utilization protein B/C n=1 Tax=Formosa sediminum TaxID=2594004 RepID=A0A516GQQ7_9FLAO|nr:LUD domain-containing protein [Formosa sediminum]QDO93836.1 lactate utilization protein B/C [Formosa sediminum]
MSLFRKLFGSKSNKSEEEIQSEDRGKYMPEIKLPIDEKFTINFKENGGKFLYCENLDEIFQTLDFIIEENNWEDKKILILENNLKKRFASSSLNIAKHNEADATYFLTSCESLIADDGSLLICSNQIAEKKLADLPSNFIVFSTTSQIVGSISEGLRNIKSKNTQKIPSNITTIKHFKFEEEKNFLTYGSNSKNLYLLLLEDL